MERDPRGGRRTVLAAPREAWRFFAADELVGRLTGVLDAEPDVFQVGVNLGDATELTGICATEDKVRRAPDAGRYVVTDAVASGPAMFETARWSGRAA